MTSRTRSFPRRHYALTERGGDSARGGAKRVVEWVPGSRRLLNTRVASASHPLFDDCATARLPSPPRPGATDFAAESISVSRNG
jgi:hypothetical protein